MGGVRCITADAIRCSSNTDLVLSFSFWWSPVLLPPSPRVPYKGRGRSTFTNFQYFYILWVQVWKPQCCYNHPPPITAIFPLMDLAPSQVNSSTPGCRKTGLSAPYFTSQRLRGICSRYSIQLFCINLVSAKDRFLRLVPATPVTTTSSSWAGSSSSFISISSVVTVIVWWLVSHTTYCNEELNEIYLIEIYWKWWQ